MTCRYTTTGTSVWKLLTSMFRVTSCYTLVLTFRDRIQRNRVQITWPERRLLLLSCCCTGHCQPSRGLSVCHSLTLIAPVFRNNGIELLLLLALLLLLKINLYAVSVLLSSFYTSLLAFCNLFESNKRFMLKFDSNVSDDSMGRN